MDTLVYVGTALALVGLVGIVWSVIKVTRLRREGLDDEAFKARMQKIVPLNLGALMLSLFGLVMVVIGVVLTA